MSRPKPFSACISPPPVLDIRHIGAVLGNEALMLGVVSPDPGGAKRAELFREALEQALGCPISKAFADKHRSAGIVSGDIFAGDVAGSTALIIDDLLSTGNTLLRAAQAARQAGANRVIAIVTYGVFLPGAADNIAAQ